MHGITRQAFGADAGYVYQAWPNKLRYDATRDKFVCAYNANDPDHIGTRASVIFFRSRGSGVADQFGPAAVVLDLEGSDIYVECNGFVILPSGDYIVYVVTRAGTNVGAIGTGYVMRSQDGGTTWSQYGQLTKGAALTGSTDQIITPRLMSQVEYTGGQIFFLYTSVTGNIYVMRMTPEIPHIYSNEVLTDRTAVGSPTYGGEGRFVDCGGGVIVCIARRNIDADYSTAMRPMFIKSVDSGVTWSAWAYCTPERVEMTNNNMDYTDAGDGFVNLYWSSRKALHNGQGALWYSRVSKTQLANGDIGVPSRIETGAPSKNFGYPGSAISVNPAGKTELIVWYDGVDSLTTIKERVEYTLADARYPGYVPGARRTGAQRTD